MISFEPKLKLEDCRLFCAGHGGTESEFVAPDETYKIVSVTDGSGTLHAFGGEFAIQEKNVVFLLPEEKFLISGEKGNELSYNFVAFTVNSGKYRTSFECLAAKAVSDAGRVFLDENITFSLNNLCNELERERTEMSAELLSLISSQVLLYILRRFGEDAVESQYTDDANVKVCNRVMGYIDERVYSMKSLREVAAAMGYNYSYISTLFHKTTGITLNNYFKTKRMNEAKKLLADEKMTISEIARLMNYSSVYAFSKAFKEHFGMSPGHYSGRLPTKE